MTNNLQKLVHASWRVCAPSKFNIVKDVCITFVRKHSSTLFISGRYANSTFSILTPYIDLDERLQDVDKFQKNLASRGIEADVAQIKNVWNFYKDLMSDKNALEEHIQRLSNEAKDKGSGHSKLMKKTDAEKEEMLKYQLKIRVLKNDLKNVKEAIWDIEDSYIPEILKLPTEIDEKTPLDSSIILKEVGTLTKLSETEKKHHINIGKNLGIVEYINRTHFYLCNEAAFFELGVLKYAAHILDNEGMLRVAGADFCRSTMIEAVGLDHKDPLDSFILFNHPDVKSRSSNRMHVVGGASLMSFLALHTKQQINPKSLPFKYYATGRQYVPSHTNLDGLFTACQSSGVHIFSVIKEKTSEEYKMEFNNIFETVCKLYDNICDHYRVVMRSASELQPWETMRVSFEIWSQFNNQYVEVGHISAHSDYFSKRLLIAYQTSKGRDFPVIISGTVLSVPKLLACLLEENPHKFIIPDEIMKCIPTDLEISTDLNTKEEEKENLQEKV